MQAIAANKLRIAVHVEHIDRRERHCAMQHGKLGEHVLTQLAVTPLHDGQAPAGKRRFGSDGL